MNIVSRVREVLARIDQVDRPEVWISRVPDDQLLARAAELDAGPDLPLRGVLVAVKDNIDVAGLPTTAACPSYAYQPERDATVVARLKQAGALVIGKTNMDQFATGLVGTRSPYGAVRHATRPDRISGGSSAGSAVAVALGLADIALGTDTAGSGRVPAALHGIVGLKPTRGLLPATGVVPAARSYDCVSVFARDLTLAQRALRVMSGPDGIDALARPWPDRFPLGPRANPIVGVASDLSPLSPAEQHAYRQAVQGLETVEVDIAPFLEAARLLYEGALVAERYDAVGEFIDQGHDDLDPTVAAIIGKARDLPAHRLAQDQLRLAEYALHTTALRAGLDALVLPTTVGHPTLAEVAADPVGTNSRMGTYTNFVNLLDLCAIAVPAGEANGSPFGVSVIAGAFGDQVAADIGALITGEQLDGELLAADSYLDVIVFGAHLRGQPLNPRLRELGGRFRHEVYTSADYRMVALDGAIPRPGLIPAAGNGKPQRGERWSLSRGALGVLLTEVLPPLSIGPVQLEDGSSALGYLCDAQAADRTVDITEHQGWVEYLSTIPGSGVPG
ncbi:allophanate hydrolase [Pseudonocardiaceae bacterium YIM PH 21723]|nr:allophanate hydrolase [Pseudonocardiaceae bacterium YIM PH 21723]